jgi:hypothetical protein
MGLTGIEGSREMDVAGRTSRAEFARVGVNLSFLTGGQIGC